MINEGVCGLTMLREAVTEVFETMMFMDVEEAPAPELIDHQSCILGSISFKGKFDGTLNMICTLPCATSITLNVLGLDDENEIDHSDIPDAIGEVANMTMGSIKAKLYQSVGDLSVSVPMVVSGEHLETELRKGDTLLETHVLVDGIFPLGLKLVYRGGQQQGDAS